MARLPGDAATEKQRRDQVQIAARTAAQVARNFQGVAPTDYAGQRNFIEASIPRVIEGNRLSAASAARYATLMSALEGGGVDDIEMAPPPAVEAIRTSLRVTGPIALTQKISRIQGDGAVRARQVEAARQSATATVAAASVRHTLSGGRDTIEQYAEQQYPGQRVRGYVRVTAKDDRVCYFCAVLASRANYLEDSFNYSDQLFEGGGTAKVHDGCRCCLRPVYGTRLPDSVIMYRQAWKDMSGGDASPMLNFRRAWDKRASDWYEKAA